MEGSSRNLGHGRSASVNPTRKHRDPQKDPAKIMISPRLDRDVVEALRATGNGWRSRIHEALRKLVDR
jgi:uncharacterized protein (DUF4415 family)